MEDYKNNYKLRQKLYLCRLKNILDEFNSEGRAITRPSRIDDLKQQPRQKSSGFPWTCKTWGNLLLV